jgi:hypothetical protein
LFLFDAKKSAFRLFSHLKQNGNEAKTKRKRRETKRNEKFLEAKQSKNTLSINFALVVSEKFEAKSEKKNFFSHELAKRISFRFVSLKQKKFLAETGAP